LKKFVISVDVKILQNEGGRN